MLDAYEGPSSWMLRLASHLPMSMLSSRDLPWAIPAVKPPAKASLEKPSGRKFFTEDEVHLPSTVGVDDAVLGDFLDGPLLDVNLTAGLHGSRDSGQGTLSDNGGPWAVVVLLGQLSQLLGDLNNVLSTPAVALRVRTGLGFVAESVVGVGQNFIELVLEELRNEGSRERKHEDLFFACQYCLSKPRDSKYIPCS